MKFQLLYILKLSDYRVNIFEVLNKKETGIDVCGVDEFEEI